RTIALGHNVRMDQKDRLIQAIKEAGYDSPTEAWRATKRALGFSQSLVINNANGNNPISKKAAAVYAKVFGRTAGWYLYGDDDSGDAQAAIEVPHLTWISAGAMMHDDVSDEAIGTVKVADLPPGDWIALTVVGD